MKLLTFQDIIDMKPCENHHPIRYIPKTWTGTILDILNLPNVQPTEKLWVSRRALDDKILRLFAVNCARRALLLVKQPDPRSLIAVNLAEAYAYGRASAQELADAADAATDAATYTADAAAYAADAAADTAAYAADAATYAAAATYAVVFYDAAAAAARKKERKTQVAELIRIIKENV